MQGIVRIAIVIGVVGLASRGARADESWYFHWSCVGACTSNGMTASGVDGPYPSDGDCELASNAKAFDLNREGSAGEVDACYSDSVGGASGGGGTGAARAVRFDRLYLSALYGDAWKITYQDGATATTGATSGATLALGFGQQKFGFMVGIGVTRTADLPVPAMPAVPMWTFELQVGLHSSPFRIAHGRSFELRPELAFGGAEVWRLGCDHCDPNPADIFEVAEPKDAFVGRLSVGLDLFLGKHRASGVAIEGVLQGGRMKGDSVSIPKAGLIGELTAPVWLVRLSYVVRNTP